MSVFWKILRTKEMNDPLKKTQFFLSVKPTSKASLEKVVIFRTCSFCFFLPDN